MKTDTLTVVDTGYDDSTGFYVNDEKVAEVHCNDEHEIPGVLYDLMVKFNFAKVVEKQLSDSGRDKYEEAEAHPDNLSAYSPEDFE